MKTNYLKRLVSTALFAFLFLSVNAVDHTLNQSSGNFTVSESNYIDDMYEVWYINTGENKSVKLNFHIDIEDDCDFVDIYSIDSNGIVSSTPIASYSGYFEEGEISTVIPSGRAKVVFYSDGSVSNDYGYFGFDMSFSVDNSFTTNVNSYTSGNSYVNGKFGIGVVNPLEKLHINGSVRGNSTNGSLRIQTPSGYIDLGSQNSAFANIYTDRGEFAFNQTIDLLTGKLTSYANTNLYLQTGRGTTRMTLLNSNGNVGIGTTTPGYKLDVAGNARVTNELYISGSGSDIGGSLSILNTAKASAGQASKWTIYNMSGSYGNSLQFWAYDNIGCTSGGTCNSRLILMDNGNVGIGTSPANITDKLTVNGTIHASEVKVDLNNLADFVFHPSYNLMPLNQVEQFVKTNSHLPEIPSAAEITKNGLSVGEMQNKLLQKIEELTLYVIEQQKQIERQSAEIEALKRR